jgi:hypothetical protein
MGVVANNAGKLTHQEKAITRVGEKWEGIKKGEGAK